MNHDNEAILSSDGSHHTSAYVNMDPGERLTHHIYALEKSADAIRDLPNMDLAEMEDILGLPADSLNTLFNDLTPSESPIDFINFLTRDIARSHIDEACIPGTPTSSLQEILGRIRT